MAETTTATSCPASTSRLTCRATLRMRSISATEVPPNFITRRAMTRSAFSPARAPQWRLSLPAQKGAYAYRRDAWPATPVAHAGTTSSADRADNAVMPVVTLVKRFEFDYSWGRSRPSFPFTRIGSMVSCQPFATPAMLDQNAIHNRIGITLLL